MTQQSFFETVVAPAFEQLSARLNQDGARGVHIARGTETDSAALTVYDREEPSCCFCYAVFAGPERPIIQTHIMGPAGSQVLSPCLRPGEAYGYGDVTVEELVRHFLEASAAAEMKVGEGG